MTLKLYKTDSSPPVRAVYLTAKALNINLEYEEVNLVEGQNFKEEFLKLNPQHSLPTLVDNDKIIWDSHAINIYLVTKYGKDDSLYPSDHYKRAIVNQRLHFDSGVLFPTLKRIGRPIVFEGSKTIPENLIKEAHSAYKFLEQFLEGHQWVAGDTLTIADFSMITTFTGLEIFVPMDANNHPNIVAWLKRVQQIPYYSVAQEGQDDFRNIVEKLMK